MHNLIYISLSLVFLSFTNIPTKITWETLKDVTCEDKYNKEVNAFFLYPKFGESVKKLDGKEVYIRGYMIAVDVETDFYVLSANNFASCFFCGGGGPESVIELELKTGHRKYQTDERVTIKGVLRLNDTNVDRMNYILENAVEYAP